MAESHKQLSQPKPPSYFSGNFRLHSHGFCPALFQCLTSSEWVLRVSVNVPENLQMCGVCKFTYSWKNNHPQDMFLACVCTQEISRPGVPQSSILAALVNEVAHHTVSSIGSGRGQASSSIFRFASGTWQVISKWGEGRENGRAKTQLHLYIVSSYKMYDLLCARSWQRIQRSIFSLPPSHSKCL